MIILLYFDLIAVALLLAVHFYGVAVEQLQNGWKAGRIARRQRFFHNGQ